MATGKIDSYVGEELVDMQSQFLTGFVAGDFKYFKRGKTVCVFINNFTPSTIGNNQLAAVNLPPAKLQTFSPISKADGTSMGLAYVGGSGLYVNINQIDGGYFSLIYECE